MLQVKSISKEYKTGELVQKALNGVSLTLRDNEFVSILGPSGSGKTTLLNIIGGLDRYDSGDLVINGVSTKNYKDRDWDTYRNHTIGFVFQSYNLIPHQSILANVELALTIGGISRKERRQRAKEALTAVGLGEQVHKRPNQLSGGQMQRVAIARALVNDPDILLADEPTGALDSETSIQVMELLKKVAKDRLVVMVTHNPELAEQYSTRIVRLRDGNIIDDSNPFDPAGVAAPVAEKPKKLAKMSFFTSLALSFNNLRTKKARTLLTAFAGSIGIIGIALILSLSTGVNQYITDIQKETMTSYPIVISAESLDLSGILEMHDSMVAGMAEEQHTEPEPGLHADYTDIELSDTVINSIKENNLTEFQAYLDDPDSEIHQFIGENGISCSYDVSFSVFTKQENGLRSTDDDVTTQTTSGSGMSGNMNSTMSMGMSNMQLMSSMVTGSSSGAENFEQLMAGANGEAVSPIVTNSYELLYGEWPQEKDELVLVLSRSNSLTTEVLYQLGLLSAEDYKAAEDAIEDGEEAEERSWSYEELCEELEFYLVPSASLYAEQEDGTFALLDASADEDEILEQALTLHVTGVVRPIEGDTNATLTSPLGYTKQLTDYVIEQTDSSPVVTAQEADPEINVLNGMEFEAMDDEKKAEDAKAYLQGLSVSEKAMFYQMAQSMGMGTSAETETAEIPEGMTAEQLAAMQAQQAAAQPTDEASMATALDLWLENDPDEEMLLTVYDNYIDGASYDDNLKAFGKVKYESPSSISIYTDSFEDKEEISDCIERYNQGKAEENQITYTDYVGLLTGSITSIVNMISYVLIAFVGVSLVVSCIMIGIITHISVLERTKEIGILRALGASKGNISQVFNAETIIIGLCAGGIGVGVSALLNIPINSIIHTLTGSDSLNSVLDPTAAVILVIISVIITVIGGLLPAKSAAKKDPVTALRTE